MTLTGHQGKLIEELEILLEIESELKRKNFKATVMPMIIMKKKEIKSIH